MAQYDHPLLLTSPPMHGQRVKDAQFLLKHNRFDGLAPYKDGDLDGVYGPLTAQAVRRVKYWLGYPSWAVDGVFGQTLYEYLRPTAWRPLPKTQRALRAYRLHKAEEENQPGLKALRLAETQLGYHENPMGSNRTKYGEWFGYNGVAWCAIEISWCLWHTGWTKFKSAAVYEWDLQARLGNHGLYIVRSPRKGDLVAYSPNKHIAFFDQWLDGNTFQDLGGNTSDGIGWSAGGEVAHTRRHTYQVQNYIRIGG